MVAATSDRDAASHACCLELPRSIGQPPELTYARYVEGVGSTGNGALLSTAARFYLERHPDTLLEINLADSRHCTACFIKAFAVHPARVTTAECQQVLADLEIASGTTLPV